MSHDMKRELHGDKSLLPSVPALEIVLPLSRRTRQRHRREGREIILLLSGDSSRHVEFLQFLCEGLDMSHKWCIFAAVNYTIICTLKSEHIFNMLHFIKL